MPVTVSESRKRIETEDPMWLAWQEKASAIYDLIYYQSNPVVSFINSHGHVECERNFGPDVHFSKVLEIGAGTGEHLGYVRHTFDRYHMTDLSSSMLDKARNRHGNLEKVVFEQHDALNLSFPDQCFDRLISVYNLEHLPNPHEAIREWKRVVKKGGVISISIPTEGGLAWNTGRFLTTRRSFAKEGLNLDYIIAREHVNACYRLVSLINYYFPEKSTNWFPFAVPTPHLNLIYTCTAVVT